MLCIIKLIQYLVLEVNLQYEIINAEIWSDYSSILEILLCEAPIIPFTKMLNQIKRKIVETSRKFRIRAKLCKVKAH